MTRLTPPRTELAARSSFRRAAGLVVARSPLVGRRAVLATMLLGALVACEDKARLSADQAKAHALELAKVAESDVAYVKQGLPEGAKYLEALFRPPKTRQPSDQADPGADAAATGQAARDAHVIDAQEARDALETARGKVQDLRVAKSTFFAAVRPDGSIVRSDQEQDSLAGKNLFAGFPEAKTALSGRLIETRGSLEEAAGVKGRSDGQWLVAVPVSVAGKAEGLYVSGWSWSSYAYALEFTLRNDIKSEVPEGESVPLIYVYIVVDDQVYGAPVSPEANAAAIAKLDPMNKAKPGQPFVTQLELGRPFGLAVAAAPSLGPRVGIAVLRSEV